MATKTLDKADAERLAREANQRLHAIRDAERYDENKGLLGKTFKCRNNYSCPKKPSDYWWHYVKVQKVDDAGMLTVFMFETDMYGKTSTGIYEHRCQLNDYTPCPTAEFNKAWRTFQKRIETMEP